MSEYEMARIDQHETRIQALERRMDNIESSLSTIKWLIFCVMAEVPVGLVIL